MIIVFPECQFDGMYRAIVLPWFLCNTWKYAKKGFPSILMICLLQTAHVGSIKTLYRHRNWTQKHYWTQIDGHRNWKSLCYITTFISCIWKWNWNERETDTETQRHLFFVYCHIIWRLQLLDDLHLVGLPLDDAKVTKQLWKERSCEEIWYLTNMFYHISINIKGFFQYKFRQIIHKSKQWI